MQLKRTGWVIVIQLKTITNRDSERESKEVCVEWKRGRESKIVEVYEEKEWKVVEDFDCL